MRYVLGQADYALNHFNEAITQFEQVRTRHPDFEPVYFDLMEGYVQSRQRDKAIRVLQTARVRWPRDPDVYNALGVTQVAAGALDDAIKTLEEGIAVAPGEALTALNLGKALEMRYFRKRRYLRGSMLWVTNERDRGDALSNYQKYLQSNGPYADIAREGIARLQAVNNKPIR